MWPSGVRTSTPLACANRLDFASKEKRKFAALVAASIDSCEPVRKCQPESVSGRRKRARAFFFFSAAICGVSRKARSSGIWPLSGGSNPTFCKAAGMVAAVGPTLPGIVCACRVHVASNRAAIPMMLRTFFISSLLLRRRRGRSGQTFLRDDLHRIFDGNLRDVRVPVDPAKLVIRFRVSLQLVAQILLWIGLMAGNTLQPRFRRHGSKILAESLAGGRRRRIGGSGEIRGEAQNINANHQRSDHRQAESKKIAIDGLRLDVALFERDIRVARHLARVVGLSAHDAR